MNFMSANLSEHQFRTVSELIHRLSGINLKNGKEALVRARLMKRIRALKMSNFSEYISYIKSGMGEREIGFLIDVMTTNKTSFFRESAHFDFLEENVLPRLQSDRLRFWTAACSSGEESYSLGILLRERLPGFYKKDVKILATDISRTMLEKARTALYTEDQVKDIPRQWLNHNFNRFKRESTLYFQVKDIVRGIVRVAWLNLVATWPMRGPFNVIFCRNVMIYFDRSTQQVLVNRLWELLEPGGFLFVGHSEGLSAISHKFRYIQPAIYQK